MKSLSISAAITSRDNVKFKALRALAEDAREPRKQGRAIADGIHLVATAIARGAQIQQLIISEAAQNHPEVVALQMHNPMLDALVLRDTLYREISALSAAVGISAVVEIPPTPVLDLSDFSLGAVVLDAVQDAGNVGAILRTAAAAGVGTVVLGSGCAGAWTPRVLRAGQGAHFSLTIHEQIDLAEMMKNSRTGITSVATVAEDAESIYELNLGKPIVWLFGNEGAGLSPALAGLASHRATIPLDTNTESLNVGAAAAICLFEAVRQRRVTSTN